MSTSYNDFKAEWLKDILLNSPTSIDKGRRFAKKLLRDWIDFNEELDEIIFCDGAGDGGIDAVYYHPGDSSETNSNDGDTWYLVQSKYGYAYQGEKTLVDEVQKIINSIDGLNPKLSNLSKELIDRLNNFRLNSKDSDKLIIVFATVDPISEEENIVLDKINEYGKKVLGNVFEVEKVSLQTVFNNLEEKETLGKQINVSLTTSIVPSGEDILVGSIKLSNLYEFLNKYERTSGSIELIYDKNVRKYLGGNRVVNRGIAKTIQEEPQRFGLYNNGITIVVEDFKITQADSVILTNPYVVNGCQTTKTIWNELKKKNFKNKPDDEMSEWEKKISKGIVVVKIVKVGQDGDELSIKTTKFTNSQNTVSQKDFIALERSFKAWQSEMSSSYKIYLEIQRGGWTSLKAQNASSFETKEFKDHVFAFDLLKIYGSGWMTEPGIAFSKNAAFAPNGSVFNKIMKIDSFGVEDLYAAYIIFKLTEECQFGRNSAFIGRRMSRYLFVFIIINLIKKMMQYGSIDTSYQNISKAVIHLFSDRGESAQNLLDSALNILNMYFTETEEISIYKEPKFHGDVAGFIKNDSIGKDEDYCPNLIELIHDENKQLKRSKHGQPAMSVCIIADIKIVINEISLN